MKKKILFCMDNLLGGGTEKVLINILDNINYEKYDVTLSLITLEGKYINNINKNVKTKYLFNFKDKNKLFILIQKILRKLLIFSIKYFNTNYLYKIIVKELYDVEISFMEGMTSKIISKSNNKKSIKITWMHTNPYKYDWYKKYFKNKKEEEKVYNSFDKIICVSKNSMEGFIEKYGNEYIDRLKVIYNPVDIVSIKEKSNITIKEINNNYFNLCYIGRLEEEKGIVRLINISKELFDEGIGFHLKIIGDGSLKKYIEEYIYKNNLIENIKLYGFKNNPYPYMKLSNVLVCPSHFEGFSLVVAEALVLNKVVLSTDCGGPTELLNNGEYGIVCKNDDLSLKMALRDLISKDDLYNYYLNKEKEIVNKFNIEHVMREIHSLLDLERD